jgi:hypothetical protein
MEKLEWRENQVISMTLKETVLHELETADEMLLEELLQIIRSRKQTPPIDRTPNHPLRSIPIVVPADFNEPMTDFWQAVEQ